GGIDTRGGTAVNAGSAGGVGGNVTLASGTVRINGVIKGKPSASIIASSGTSGSGVLNPDPGVISIQTFGTQPLPLNFDLASTVAAEPALPGGMFEIGVPTVNGTKGALVSGSDIRTTGRVIKSCHNTAFINVSATGNEETIAQGSLPSVVINTLVDPGSPNTSPRRLVTPGQALALFQVSRNLLQTIGLTSVGAVSDTAVGGG